MAQRVETTITDDLSGEPGASTVRFGLDGQEYEIDLTDANADGLRAALAQYVAAARRVKANGKPQSKGSGDRRRSSEVRQWARQHGFVVEDRGRIPGRVVEAYERERGATAA